MSNFTDFIGGASGGDGGALWWDDIYDNIQEFTTSGTFNVPADCSKVTIGICGGGAGGNVTNNNGGGGSGMTYHTLDVVPGDSITVTIGAHGAHKANGGSSSFGPYITVDGGFSNGKGGNYGGDASGWDSGKDALLRGSEITVSRAINGVLVFKTIPSGIWLGGAGGGYDYEGRPGTTPTGYGTGSNTSNLSDPATDGICVVWY